MPPPIFKAVCTETGREYHLPDLDLAYTPSIGGKGGLCWGLFHEEIDGFKFEAMPEVCQSTGLTDSRGVEVFEGDVLACKCHADIAVVWVQGSEPEDPVAAWGWKYAHPDFDHVEYHNTFQRSGICLGRSVIGNKWMPAAELRARAEAVSNG